MLFIKRIIYYFCIAMMTALSYPIFADDNINIPILCYHNFNPTKPGSMNLTPAKLEMQIKWMKDNGFTFIPLNEVVEYLQGKRASLPAKSVVITADDGWKSVYTYMLPLAQKYHIPVTLFIYPQTISQGKNAMTWDELKELQNTGLFDIQGHTYDHPNFKKEMRRRSPADYEKFVNMQLARSKNILDDKLGIKVSLLAWPFGIYNDYLQQQAAKAGYTMAFSIDARAANKSYRPMSQPRYMIVDGLTMNTFKAIVTGPKTTQHVAGVKQLSN